MSSQQVNSCFICIHIHSFPCVLLPFVRRESFSNWNTCFWGSNSGGENLCQSNMNYPPALLCTKAYIQCMGISPKGAIWLHSSYIWHSLHVSLPHICNLPPPLVAFHFPSQAHPMLWKFNTNVHTSLAGLAKHNKLLKAAPAKSAPGLSKAHTRSST